MHLKHYFKVLNMCVLLILLMMGNRHKTNKIKKKNLLVEIAKEVVKEKMNESQNSQINLPKAQPIEDYEVKISPKSVKSNEVTQGGIAKYRVQVIPKNEFKGNVKLDIDKSKIKNFKVTLNKETVKPGDNDITLTIDTSTSLKPSKNSYDFKVIGKSKGLTRRDTGKLKVKP